MSRFTWGGLLPTSNIWITANLQGKVPEGHRSTLARHLGMCIVPRGLAEIWQGPKSFGRGKKHGELVVGIASFIFPSCLKQHPSKIIGMDLGLPFCFWIAEKTQSMSFINWFIKEVQVTCFWPPSSSHPGIQPKSPGLFLRCQVTQYRVWEDPRRSNTRVKQNSRRVLLFPKKNHDKKKAIYIPEAKNNTIVVQYLFVQVLGVMLQTPRFCANHFWTPFGAMAGLKQAEKWRIRRGATESQQSFQWWGGRPEAEKFPTLRILGMSAGVSSCHLF